MSKLKKDSLDLMHCMYIILRQWHPFMCKSAKWSLFDLFNFFSLHFFACVEVRRENVAKFKNYKAFHHSVLSKFANKIIFSKIICKVFFVSRYIIVLLDLISFVYHIQIKSKNRITKLKNSKWEARILRHSLSVKNNHHVLI